MLPNPCRFSVNDVWFAATSVDVLFHLRKEEFFKSASEISPVDNDEQPWDAMSSMCQHLFQQRRYVFMRKFEMWSYRLSARSFYPIFPPPIDVMHDINFDVSHSDMLDIGDEEQQSPHVLILPSRLKQFSKVGTDVSIILGLVKLTVISLSILSQWLILPLLPRIVLYMCNWIIVKNI